MASTIATTLRARSGRPWGSSESCATLAAVNNMAERFGQAATQAPQPMQVAASKALSAADLVTGSACASGAAPAFTDI